MAGGGGGGPERSSKGDEEMTPWGQQRRGPGNCFQQQAASPIHASVPN